MKFSLKTLLIFVTMAAVFLGLYQAIGDASFVFGMFGLLVFVGFAAHKVENPFPYWQCIGSIAILIFLLPPLGYRPTEAETIMSSILFAIGGYLAYAAIRHGHWSTRLLAIVVISPYLLFICLTLIEGLSNWERIVDYWMTEPTDL